MRKMRPFKKVYEHIKNYLKLKKDSPYSQFDIRTTIRRGVVCEGYNSIEKDCIIEEVKMGIGTYIGFGSQIYQSEIGRFCSIGRNLKIIQGQHPTHDFISTYPAFYREAGILGMKFVDKQLFEENRFVDKEKRIAVKIGNDVWIGDNVSIMEGVTIGDGAVIATGAVVVEDVSPFCIVGGVPAKKIRYRFNPYEIESLLKLKWWNRDLKWIKQNAVAFCSIQNIAELLKER